MLQESQKDGMRKLVRRNCLVDTMNSLFYCATVCLVSFFYYVSPYFVRYADDVAMGKDLSIGVPRNPDLQIKGPNDKVLGKIASNEKAVFLDPDKKKDRDKLERNLNEYNNETAKDEFQNKDNDLTCIVTVISIPQGGSAQDEVANETSKLSKIKDMDKKELPSLELSLKRLRDVSNTGISAQERNKLRQSDHSAFSRYGNGN